jgi:sulfotransferase
MQNNIHFISGLPRAGSTLLSALLSQNPRFHASMSSPMETLFKNLLQSMSQNNEYALFIDDEQRKKILSSCFAAYYHALEADQVIFDTNRAWTTRLDALTQLFPSAKVICCVRNVAWVVDSIESLVRRNAFEPSKIFNCEAGGTVYSRAEGLTSGTGMVGFSVNALREAVYSPHAERLLLVRYESLTSDPLGTLNKIYQFIGEPLFPHDANNVQSFEKALEFDARLGTVGLHSVGSKVHKNQRRSILPPDLFNRYEPFSFWQNKGEMPTGVRVI